MNPAAPASARASLATAISSHRGEPFPALPSRHPVRRAWRYEQHYPEPAREHGSRTRRRPGPGNPVQRADQAPDHRRARRIRSRHQRCQHHHPANRRNDRRGRLRHALSAPDLARWRRPTTHAFAITTAAFAEVALLATATAALTTLTGKSRDCDPRAEPIEAGGGASLAPRSLRPGGAGPSTHSRGALRFQPAFRSLTRAAYFRHGEGQGSATSSCLVAVRMPRAAPM